MPTNELNDVSAAEEATSQTMLKEQRRGKRIERKYPAFIFH
jgi:hypothetical protein